MLVKTRKKDNNKMPKDYVLNIARNIEEINSIRNIWEGFQSRPNSDIDHYLHVIAQDKSVIRPHVTLLQHCGKPVALAVGRIEYERFPCKFGYKIIYDPMVKILEIVYDGLLGDFSIDNSKIILDSFLQTLRLENLELIRFSYLRIDSPMYEIVRKYPGFITRDHLKLPSLHWRMHVPENIEEIYSRHSRKHRYWLRKIRKVLENDFPGQVHYKIYTDVLEIDEFIVNAETVARKTYQWGMGYSFKDSPEMRKRLTAFVERKQLRAYILYIRNNPCTFWLGRSYGDTFYLTHTGYDPEYKKYTIGMILFIRMVQDLVENTNIDYIDFGFSDQVYKERFGNEHWEEEDVYLFAPSWRGLKLNIIRKVIGTCWVYTTGMLNKLGIKNKMKRLMRDRLIKGLKNKSNVTGRENSEPKIPTE